MARAFMAWRTSGADRVLLGRTGGVATVVDGFGSRSECITTTTQYSLQATNADGSATRRESAIIPG